MSDNDLISEQPMTIETDDIVASTDASADIQTETEIQTEADADAGTDDTDTEMPDDVEVDASFDLTEGADAHAEQADEGVAAEEDPWLKPGSWYVVHSQSGYEKKVTANLNARIQSMNMEEKIFEIVIPMEEVVEFKNGRKQTVQKKVFPGYLLVRCIMDDESWYCIRNTRCDRLRRSEPPGPKAHTAVAP